MLPFLLLSQLCVGGLHVDGDVARATITDAFTSVTIDICALKEGLDFSNPQLVKAARNLGGTVLRIGGALSLISLRRTSLPPFGSWTRSSTACTAHNRPMFPSLIACFTPIAGA